MERGRGDRGQAVPLLLGALALGLVLLVALSRVAVAAVDAARARTTADAAALAGARGGRSAAAEAAADNGGRLVAFTQIGPDVLVTVVVGHASATARATLAVEFIGRMTLPSGSLLRTLRVWRSRTGPPVRRSRAPTTS